MTPDVPTEDWLELRVRYTECDPMGVAHHTAYPVWFEMGRTELQRSRGRAYRDMETAGFSLAVVRLEVRYRAPARYDDQLRLHTELTRLTRTRLEHAYALYRDGHLLTTGQTTLVCLDASGALIPLPLDDLSA